MIGYLIALVAVFLLCFMAYRLTPQKYADLMGVSALLAFVFFISNLLIAMYGLPDALLAFPVLDCFLAVMICRAWLRSRERWKVVMVSSLVGQLVLHVVVVSMWKTGNLTQYGLYLYVVAINAFFIIQLLALGGVGAGHGLDRLLRYLSDRRGSRLVSDAWR